MRFTRLKNKIKNGTLTGTHGTPFAGGIKEKTIGATKKRKSTASEISGKPGETGGIERERLDELGPVMKLRTRGKRVYVSLEDEGEIGYLSSGSSSEYGDSGAGDLDTEDDSDDDLPLLTNRPSKALKKRSMDGPWIGAQVHQPVPGNLADQHLRLSLSNALSASSVLTPKETQVQALLPAQNPNRHIHRSELEGQLEQVQMQPGDERSQPPVTTLQNSPFRHSSREPSYKQEIVKADWDLEGI
jgi:hypothetical protein